MQWISVKERLPSRKKFKEVLTFEYIKCSKTKKKIPIIRVELAEDIYMDLKKEVCWSEGDGENITHWMPLPEPPEC